MFLLLHLTLQLGQEPPSSSELWLLHVENGDNVIFPFHFIRLWSGWHAIIEAGALRVTHTYDVHCHPSEL